MFGSKGQKTRVNKSSLLVALALCFPIAACGFAPVYDGSALGVDGQLSDITITPIPERLGQLVRARLLERIQETSDPTYRLDVLLETETFQFGLRGDDPDTGAIGDAAATQEEVSLIARYKLIDVKKGETVLEESQTARSSFDLVLSDFAIVAQREDTTRRLALELVDRIERRLFMYLKDNSL